MVTRFPLPLSASMVGPPPPKFIGPEKPSYPSVGVSTEGPVVMLASEGVNFALFVPSLNARVRPVRSVAPLPVATTVPPTCSRVSIQPARAGRAEKQRLNAMPAASAAQAVRVFSAITAAFLPRRIIAVLENRGQRMTGRNTSGARRLSPLRRDLDACERWRLIQRGLIREGLGGPVLTPLGYMRLARGP